ncbi:response regulator transcription factor [Rhodococcus sp. IEGM 248]|uniref:helix-turn-helix transcriptional regulator n=1 Tax=Rhodococcus opacus TaxID=37919 RepID=UPI0013BEDC4B|nr:helix-turn-helix transcriptional regulator [Rhodococcus opacus]MDV7082604.1 response regulator transcription factor [Rhodococcus opacus]NDV03823.1 response regulator transcription factor [Rhodococcus sp. IEGM 248]
MSDATSELRTGRAAFERRDWRDTYARLSGADRQTPLSGDDLELVATAAYLLGEDDASTEWWERAVHEWARVGRPVRSARCAFWLSFVLIMRGEQARGGGWLGKAQRLLDTAGVDCAERGYLLVPQGLQRIDAGDGEAARDIFRAITETGTRFADPDLTTLGVLGTGHSLVLLGDVADAVSAFDEAMVGVTSDEVSPVVAGIVYCAVIEQCQNMCDLRRSREWTVALEEWCSSQPDLVPYRGQCLVHRAEILQLQGEWPTAMDSARRAHERLASHAAAGSAAYVMADLHRLRGEIAQAEKLFLEANRWGRRPQPGLALLRMAQGRVGSAAASIRCAVDESTGAVERARLLPACVDILLAAGDVSAARTAADELDSIATRFAIPYLCALSAQASGSVLHAEGRGSDALTVLRDAWRRWQDIGAPYECARVRESVALVCRDLGDDDTAQMEHDLASATYRQLGAVPDLERLRAEFRPDPTVSTPLTPREVCVLRLVAAGKSNRAVATELFLSEKTVARHLSNIFVKLGISSRSAATAYAYEHRLVGPPT